MYKGGVVRTCCIDDLPVFALIQQKEEKKKEEEEEEEMEME